MKNLGLVVTSSILAGTATGVSVDVVPDAR
jgi:hypothetical protein